MSNVPEYVARIEQAIIAAGVKELIEDWARVRFDLNQVYRTEANAVETRNPAPDASAPRVPSGTVRIVYTGPDFDMCGLKLSDLRRCMLERGHDGKCTDAVKWVSDTLVINGWCADCGAVNTHYDHCVTRLGSR